MLYLNVIPVKLGCGWECRCAELHSIPFKVRGKGGSVTIEIIPGPRGLGLVAGENIRNLLKLAGIKDAWTKSFGSTNTMMSTTKAIFNAIRSIYNGMTLNMAFVVLRIRGSVNVPYWAKYTLDSLNLYRNSGQLFCLKHGNPLVC